MMFNYVDHIIRVLKKEQVDNPILSQFLLKYPSKEIAQSSNTIYIGFSEARATNRTHNSQDYDELIDIIIEKILNFMINKFDSNKSCC